MEQPAKTIRLEELLAEQTRIAMLATLDPVDDHEKVRITPYYPGQPECGCDGGFIVPRSAITSVTPTGYTVPCCGTVHRVVEIDFEERAHMPLKEVYSLVAGRAKQTGRKGSVMSGARTMLSATGTTCICDHFIRRFCSAGQMYEEYACYDDTGAYCGNTTVALGISCPEGSQNLGQLSSMRVEQYRAQRASSVVSGVPANVALAPSVGTCAGEACPFADLSWDPGVSKFLAKNNHSSRYVTVSLPLVWGPGSNSVRLAPGDQSYMFVQAFQNPWHADFS